MTPEDRIAIWTAEGEPAAVRDELQHVIDLVLEYMDLCGRKITPEELAQQLGLKSP